MCYNITMSTKKHKTSFRIKLNTCLFIIAALAFFALTCIGVTRAQGYIAGMPSVVDAPGLCMDNDHTNAYICGFDIDENGDYLPATDGEELIYFVQQGRSITYMNGLATIVAIKIIGSIATIASFLGGLVYWIHNRGK